MRYYKDQYTLVDEEEMELETDYGVYLAVMSVETKFQIEEATSIRRQYVTIYEIEEEEEGQGFWRRLWNILRTKRPILPRTYIPNEKQMEDVINGWIINWELPMHQIEKAKQGGRKLRINYDRELERRTNKTENNILRYDIPEATSWDQPQHKDIDLDRTFSLKQTKRGMHPNSQANLKQNQKTS
jgi:hypothetical protein